MLSISLSQRFQLFALLFGAIGSACHATTGPETPWLRIEPTATAFAPGALVSATLRNTGMIDIELDGCFPVLEHFDRGRWNEIAVTPRANCGQMALVVAPAADHLIGIGFLPESLRSGTYRYRFHGGYVHTRPRIPLATSSLASLPFLVSTSTYSRGATNPGS